MYLCQDLTKVTWCNGVGSPYTKDGVGIFNWWTVACCFSGENPTPEMIKAMHRVFGALNGPQGVFPQLLEVKGHREISGGTECPGPAMNSWLPQVKGVI